MLASKLAVVITRVCHRHWIVVTAPNINDRNRRRCHNRPLSLVSLVGLRAVLLSHVTEGGILYKNIAGTV